MKVLWLSPWLRSLARVQTDALRARGHDVLLVTSDAHPETRGSARADEIVLRPTPRLPGSWPEFARALVAARRFGPDVVIAELVRDPRWTAFAALAPVVRAVHDDSPHDATEALSAWRARLDRWWAQRSVRTVVFSEFVADTLRREANAVDVVPLPSDLPDVDVPAFVRAARRRDFVLAGRVLPYKNVPVALAAWQRHRTGPAYRGDRLLLLGGPPTPAVLPDAVEHRPGPFRYADTVPILAAAKATLVHYRKASQSGSQVLSMQLGVMPIVSPRGALPAMQPPRGPVVDVDDDARLADAFDRLADPAAAERAGRDAQTTYDDRFSATRTAAAWESTLRRAARRR